MLFFCWTELYSRCGFKISHLLSVCPVKLLLTSHCTSAAEGIKSLVMYHFLHPCSIFITLLLLCGASGLISMMSWVGQDIGISHQIKCYPRQLQTSHNVSFLSFSAASAGAKRWRFRGRPMELWKLHFPQPPRPAPLRTVRNAAQHLSLPTRLATLPGGPWTSFFS